MHHAHIDKFAYRDSPIHRLDSRIKFVITIVFTVMVISLPRTSLAIVICYAIGPFTVLVLAKIPLKFVSKHILLISPFVLVLALSCILYDKRPVTVGFGLFSWQTTTGTLRCLVILEKFVVTMSALIALVSTTRFADLLSAMRRLYLPRLLIIQLGFLYRYIFILIDKVHHLLRARAGRRLRSLGFKRELAVTGSMLGALLIRSIDTAENVNIAMRARGFSGTWPVISKPRTRNADWFFVLAATAFMSGLYFFVRPFLQ